MLINAFIKHIRLRISHLPRIGWRDFKLIEVIVSVMVALRPSFMKAIDFDSVHLYFIFAIGAQFHFIRIVLMLLMMHGWSLLGACLLLLGLKIYV